MTSLPQPLSVQDYIDLKLVHEIHTSERRSFRACRRRWDWLFRQNYYPRVTAKPLEFGVAYHKAMETYYDPNTWSMDRDVIGQLSIVDFVDVCNKQKEKCLDDRNQQALDYDAEEDYNERVELGRGMLEYYYKHVAPKLDKGWKPVKVEIAFMVPVVNPETGEDAIWCKCKECETKWVAQLNKLWSNPTSLPVENMKEYGPNYWNEWKGLPVVYAGRLDMLAEDENGYYWIFDWKTARTIAEQYEFLYLDDQIGSYVWALRKLGLDIKGFVYHEQRKGYPVPPKQNQTTRLGRRFSVAKNQDTDYETYLHTVANYDTQALEEGFYDEFLEFLRNEGITYYSRHQVAKSIEECEEIERNIGFEALDMIDPKLRIYPSAGRFGCTFCAFRMPCMEKNAQGDFQYALDTLYERREHYYVRSEASTDSKSGE